MGYHPTYFDVHVSRWLSQGWLPKGGRLIDFGAQEFHGDHALPSVASVYRSLGIDYTAIDVDGAHGSEFFDLSTSRVPRHWSGQFDFVNNEGTIEHLANPINGFHVAHELLKVGGVARHSIPSIGWREHGFFYPTTKFFAHLVGVNQYEALEKTVLKSAASPFRDDFFTEVLNENFEPLDSPPVVENYLICLTYRKRFATPFVAPADHIIGDDAEGIKRRLAGNYAEYAGRRASPRIGGDGRTVLGKLKDWATNPPIIKGGK